MKKLALAGIVSILATVALSGCMSVPEEDTTVPADETTPVVEEETYRYESAYGFELTFPANWGKVQETVETGTDLLTANIILKSEDGKKDMMLYAVANTAEGDAYVMDAPAEKLGVGQTYTIYKEVNQGIDILEAQGEDVSEERALENELNQITATFKTVEQEEGGGGVADPEDNFTTAYTEGKDLFYGCNEEVEELNETLNAGEIMMYEAFASNSTNVTLYKTENPDKLTKEEVEAIVTPCGELGANQVLEVTDEYIVAGFPYCSGGAIPDEELQPELYADYEDCMVVQDELHELYEL